jgi:heme O synthase-like polyprenyltransferase
MSAAFLVLAWQLWRAGDHAGAPRLFGFSILYLFVLFATMIVERLVPGAV